MKTTLRSAVVGFSILIFGCSERTYEGPRRFPLSGTITVDGELMDFGTISFIPTSGEQRVSGGPIIGGQYEVVEARGANEGHYRVEVRWQKGTGKQVPNFDTGEMIELRVEGLPARYHEDSELTADVSEVKHAFDFDLSSN